MNFAGNRQGDCLILFSCCIGYLSMPCLGCHYFMSSLTGNLNVTPMRTMIVPPPWSAYQLRLPASAAQVVSPASPAEDTGNVGVLTHDNQFLVFCHNSKGEGGLLRLRKVGNMGKRETFIVTFYFCSYFIFVFVFLCKCFDSYQNHVAL